MYIYLLSIDFILLDFYFRRGIFLDTMIEERKPILQYINKKSAPNDYYYRKFFIQGVKIAALSSEIFLNDSLPNSLYSKIITKTHYYAGYKK